MTILFGAIFSIATLSLFCILPALPQQFPALLRLMQ
jgi:hypothetical protein